MRVAVLFLVLAGCLALAANSSGVASQRSANLQSPIGSPESPDAIVIPQMLSYQGRLTDSMGIPVPDGNYQLTFRLYTQPTGGSAIWTEGQTIQVVGGLFSALLGSVTPISSVPDGGALYLSLQVAVQPELMPRLRIGSVAYAYKADTANAALAAPPSGPAGGNLTGTYPNPTLAQQGATAGQVLKWTGSTWAPRNDSVGGGGGGGTVTSVSQATGVRCSPNPITTTGTVGLDTTYSDGRYIKNQYVSDQTASWRVAGRCRATINMNDEAALWGMNTHFYGYGVRGDGTNFAGVVGMNGSTGHGATEGWNTASSAGGCGVGGHGTAALGVYGSSSSNYGVFGTSGSTDGVCGLDSVSDRAGVYGTSVVTGTGKGIGVCGRSPTYWGVQGYRNSSQKGSDYGYGGTRGGLYGLAIWGDTWTFGAAGYTWGDYARTGGVIGSDPGANTWGSLGYKNSAGNWYGGYGTSSWTSGSGLGTRSATGIGCGYGGGLMGGWLRGKYYGATVGGDRYALYASGNSYTSGFSAEMQNTGAKREALYGTTSTSVEVYTSGVAEMKSGKGTVAFPASFSSVVSKDVPVVVTATPLGPVPIYLSSSDNKGFAVAAVDPKTTGSVKFSWIAVGRRAGYEKNPEVPAELCRTDFDSRMDAVMYNENDLRHSAQPVWFDGTQLRFDTPPEEPLPPKPAQPVDIGLHAPSQAPIPVVPTSDARPSSSTTMGGTTAPLPQPSSTHGATGVKK